MSIDIGVKQPEPEKIRVLVDSKPEGKERPIEVWFDLNIIELTVEQAFDLTWKLREILKPFESGRGG